MDVDFLIIGFPRCGTTWLYRTLKRHPDIFMPDKKELNFFNKNYDSGIAYYDNFFKEADYKQLCGEASPNYILKNVSIENIKKHNKEMKFIVLVRNPIVRAFSAYRFFGQQYKNLSFEQAIEYDDELVKFGQYIDYLTLWYEAFDQTRFKVVVFEDMIKDPDMAVKEILWFLNLDADTLPEIDTSVSNPSIFPGFQSFLYRYKLDWLIDIVKSTPFDKAIRSLYLTKQQKKTLPIKNATYGILLKHYDNFNSQLAKMLDLDLSTWK